MSLDSCSMYHQPSLHVPPCSALMACADKLTWPQAIDPTSCQVASSAAWFTLLCWPQSFNGISFQCCVSWGPALLTEGPWGPWMLCRSGILLPNLMSSYIFYKGSKGSIVCKKSLEQSSDPPSVRNHWFRWLIYIFQVLKKIYNGAHHWVSVVNINTMFVLSLWQPIICSCISWGSLEEQNW